ncbi:MAG: T9SS type A sorting domain-containing protein [Calditrichaeota bacterium]|nr:T9SS type A sorting domain-containing protein [Calditrichota bacterium]
MVRINIQSSVFLLLLFSMSLYSQPVNDDCSGATVVSSIPFADTVNTTTATSNPSDPSLGCNGNSNQTDGNTVWYVWTPSSDMNVHISTSGSKEPDGDPLDTVIGLYTGGCGELEAVECWDWGINDGLYFDATGGETYYIKFGEYLDGTGGGNLIVSIAPVYNKSIMIGKQERTYLLYAPAAYDGKEPWPLVINYHGFSSDNINQMEIHSKMNLVADTAHFLVAYPQGLEVDDQIFGGQGTGWNIPGDYKANHDDIAFTEEMINQIDDDFNVDKDQIYATGWSNGSFMAFYLACALPTKIAAVAGVSGPMSFGLMEACRIERPLPVLFIHGTSDPVVPFDGIDNSFPAAIETPLFWVQHNGCSEDPIVTELPDTYTNDNSTVTLMSYTGCDDESEVLFYKVNNAGHGWPGGSPSFPLIGSTNRDINASSEIWNFFKRHSNSLTNVAYGKSLEINPRYIDPNGDSLHIRAQVENPQTHSSSILVLIEGTQQSYSDSIELFDDGMHMDEYPNDNIYGNEIWLSGLNEGQFDLTLKTEDHEENMNHYFHKKETFVTYGPIVPAKPKPYIDGSYSERNRLQRIYLVLENKGNTAVAKDISAQIKSQDPRVAQIFLDIANFNEIEAGKADTSFNILTFNYSEGYTPDSTINNPIKFHIDIYNKQSLIWSDSADYIVTDIEKISEQKLLRKYSLYQNFPNPFNPSTVIHYEVPLSSKVRLTIYDLQGREIQTVVNKQQNAGHYQVTFDASNLPSGIYFYELKTSSGFSQTKKMVVLK